MAEGETCQDTERNRPSKGHSLPGDSRGRDLSGHEKKPTEPEALTSWRRQTKELVNTRKEIVLARGTHVLETAEGGTCQDTEKNRMSKLEQGSLTFWRQQREGLVRTQKETDRARRTHSLETAERQTCQDRERNRMSKEHSRPGDSRGRDLSGHGKNRLSEERSRSGDGGGRNFSGQKKTDRARGTHKLETTGGGTCQDTERN